MHHDTTKTLLAKITALFAKIIVSNAISFIQKQCPLLFPFLLILGITILLSCRKQKKPQERYIKPCWCHFSGQKSGWISLSKPFKKSHKVFVLTCGYVLNLGFWIVKNTVFLRCFLSFKYSILWITTNWNLLIVFVLFYLNIYTQVCWTSTQ